MVVSTPTENRLWPRIRLFWNSHGLRVHDSMVADPLRDGVEFLSKPCVESTGDHYWDAPSSSTRTLRPLPTVVPQSRPQQS